MNLPTKCVLIVGVCMCVQCVHDASGFPKTICVEAVWRLACVPTELFTWILSLTHSHAYTLAHHSRSVCTVHTMRIRYNRKRSKFLSLFLLQRKIAFAFADDEKSRNCMRIACWKCSTSIWLRRYAICAINDHMCACACACAFAMFECVGRLLLCGFNYCS